MQTREYAPGRRIDLFGTPEQAPVLMWHGQQPDARSAMHALGEELAGRGLGVLVPDWNSRAADGGRADLLRSLTFARKHTDHPDAIVLVGWSLGGLAAAGVTLRAAQRDLPLAHTVCLAGAFTVPDPVTGGLLTDQLTSTEPSTALTLLHGSADDVVPLSASATFAASLGRAGWEVQVTELAADHGSIAGARYDAAADRYESASDPQTLGVVAEVADRIVMAARR